MLFSWLRETGRGGDDKCKLCGAPENVNHVLFNCPITIFAWCVIKEVLNFPVIPVSFWEGLGLLKQKLGGSWV